MTGRHSFPAARAAAASLVIAAATAVTPASETPQRYLIFPFENLSSERSLNWLGEALAASLADRFELLGMRTVPRSERLDGEEGLDLPGGTPLTLASQIKLAGTLRATRLVTGTYKFDPANGVTVTGYLIDAEGAARLWDASRPGTLARIFGLMDPIVLKAAEYDTDRLAKVPLNAISSIADPPLPLFEVIVRSQQEADPDRRVVALEKGLDMNAKSPALLRALVNALYDAGRNADAVARLDAIPDGALPDAWRLHLLRARILMVRNDTDAAIAALSKSIAAGDSADAHIFLARILLSRGERARAQAEVDVAARLDPGHPEIPEVRKLLGGTST